HFLSQTETQNMPIETSGSSQNNNDGQEKLPPIAPVNTTPQTHTTRGLEPSQYEKKSSND
ncbi:MAG: hypothetical protein ACPG4X_19840, partial [Pikeienuella sp.]